MIIPSTIIIEMGIENLKIPTNVEGELVEFRQLSAERYHTLNKLDYITDVTALELGYLIGLETARIMMNTRLMH